MPQDAIAVPYQPLSSSWDGRWSQSRPRKRKADQSLAGKPASRREARALRAAREGRASAYAHATSPLATEDFTGFSVALEQLQETSTSETAYRTRHRRGSVASIV